MLCPMSDPVALSESNLPVLEARMKIVQSVCLLALVCVVTASPRHVEAQHWSPQQQEVLDAEMACLNSYVDPTTKPGTTTGVVWSQC